MIINFFFQTPDLRQLGAILGVGLEIYDVVNTYRAQRDEGDYQAGQAVGTDHDEDVGSVADDGGAQGQGRVGGGTSHTVQIVPGEIRVGDDVYYIMRRDSRSGQVEIDDSSRNGDTAMYFIQTGIRYGGNV